MARLRGSTLPLAALALLLLSVTIAFRDVLAPERGLYFGDHLHHFRPRWFFIQEAFRRLSLPALTHADPFGTPVEAIFNGTYTPLAAVFALLDFELAYDLFVWLHFVVLAAGAFLLARSLGASRPASAGAAVAAALSGPVLTLQGMPNILTGAAFAPWCWWALHRLLVGASPAAAGALGILLSFHLQAITPELALLDLLAGGSIVARHRREIDARRAALAALGGALGLAGAAIGVGPALELLSGRRGGGFAYDEAARFPLRPLMLLEYLVPDLLAPARTPFVWFPGIYGADRSPSYFRCFYSSFAPALLLSAMFVPATRRRAAILTGAFVLALVVALGPATPLHRWLMSLPLLDLGRFPVKYTLLGAAALAAGAALGFRALADSPRPFLTAAFVQAVLLAIGFTVLLGDAGRELVARTMAGGVPVTGLDREALERVAIAGMRWRAVEAFAAISAAAVVVLLTANERRAGLRAPLLAAILACDLAVAAGHVVLGAEPPREAPLPERLTASLAPGERYYVEHEGAPPFSAGADRTFFDSSIRSMMARGSGLYRGVRRFDTWDAVAQANPFVSAVWRSASRLPRPLQLRLLARAGVSVISTPAKVDLPGVETFPIRGEAPQHLVPVPEARPHLALYTRWLEIPSAEPSERLLEVFTATSTWDVALLHEPNVVPAPLPEPAAAECSRSATVSAVSIGPDGELEARVDAPCETVLVRLEPFVVGWRAVIDGAPHRVFAAEGGMLGVVVPAGSHQVRLGYEDRVGRWAWVSLAAFVISGALLASGLLLRRRRGAP